MIRKLSVTASRQAFHFLGTSQREKFNIVMLKSLKLAWHVLWGMCLCISPHNRSIGLRCG